MPPPPAAFAKAEFLLRDIIGKGGKSLGVQVAYHKPTQRYYAVKIMSLSAAAAEGWEVQPHAEAAVLHMLTAEGVPFIVQYCGQFEEAGNLYMVMTYCPGGELFSRMEGRKFSHDEAVFYLAEVFLALAGLHDLGYIYRDLKPENVLLDEDGHIHVCDMGFAIKADKAFRRIGCVKRELICASITICSIWRPSEARFSSSTIAALRTPR